MTSTTLSPEETARLTDQIARWAVSLRIGAWVAFLLEVNRPLAPFSASACIAIAPLLAGLLPIPLHQLGMLLQDNGAVARVCDRIRHLEREAVAHGAQTHS